MHGYQGAASYGTAMTQRLVEAEVVRYLVTQSRWALKLLRQVSPKCHHCRNLGANVASCFVAAEDVANEMN